MNEFSSSNAKNNNNGLSPNKLVGDQAIAAVLQQLLHGLSSFHHEDQGSILPPLVLTASTRRSTNTERQRAR
jgi:hypothetical protein